MTRIYIGYYLYMIGQQVCIRYVTAFLYWRGERARRPSFRRDIKKTWVARSRHGTEMSIMKKLAGIAGRL